MSVAGFSAAGEQPLLGGTLVSSRELQFLGDDAIDYQISIEASGLYISARTFLNGSRVSSLQAAASSADAANVALLALILSFERTG